MLAKKNRLTAGFFRTRKHQIVSFAHKSVSVRVYQASTQVFRCAVVVPVRVAKTAVLRNSVRRIVYTAIQENIANLPIIDTTFFVSRPDTVYDDIRVVVKKLMSEI
ncbi:MAG: ribonuclease P protein component [Candidatus Paceibacterota bacterium]